MLQLSRYTGKDMIGRGGAQNNQVDVAWIETCRVQRPAGGLFSEVAGRLVRCSDMTLLNAGAFDDPVRCGIDELFKISIGQDFFRQVATGSDDSGVIQSACLSA